MFELLGCKDTRCLWGTMTVERSRALVAMREVRGSNLSADFQIFEEFFQLSESEDTQEAFIVLYSETGK